MIENIKILDQEGLAAITIPSLIYILDQCYIKKCKEWNSKRDPCSLTSDQVLTDSLKKTFCWLLTTRCILDIADKNKHGLTCSAYHSVVCPGDGDGYVGANNSFEC